LLKVVPGFFLGGGVAQQVGGVEGRHEPGRGQLQVGQRRRGEVVELATRSLEIGVLVASRDWLAGRPSVTMTLGRRMASCRTRNGLQVCISSSVGVRLPGGPALDHVADVDLLAGERHGGDHLGEELAGAADEGLALGVFVGAGAFAHEDKVGAGVADAEDGLRAFLAEAATLAALDEVVVEGLEGRFSRGDGEVFLAERREVGRVAEKGCGGGRSGGFWRRGRGFGGCWRCCCAGWSRLRWRCGRARHDCVMWNAQAAFIAQPLAQNRIPCIASTAHHDHSLWGQQSPGKLAPGAGDRVRARQRSRAAVWGWGAVFALVMWPGGASADEGAPRLLGPTQGRPVFVAAGEDFQFTLQAAEQPTQVAVELVSRQPPLPRVMLPTEVKWPDAESGTWRYLAKVPAETVAATYDLRVATGAGEATARHAVAVGEVAERIRIVHLSNMNVGAFDVPRFDARLVEEVNLLAPTVIVATGDYFDVTSGAGESEWQRLADYLAAFDAPVITACGDHDSLAYYTQYLAPSAVGSVAVGPYRGLVLYDLPARSMVADDAQVQWVERALRDTGHTLSFVITHGERPNLLYHWEEQGRLRQMLASGRLGLWFAGGHCDWDGAAYGDIVAAAGNLQYLRTHESSQSVAQGASGVSHYRVVDLVGQRAVHYGALTEAGYASLAVGKLDVQFEQPVDGRAAEVQLLARNRWEFSLPNVMVRVLVRRDGDGQPWCRGAELVQVARTADAWVCWVRLDLPGKGAVRALVGSGAPPPRPPAVKVHFLVGAELAMKRVQTAEGRSFLRADDWVGVLQLQNEGDTAVEVTPLVRLGGETLGYRVVEERGPVALAYRVELKPMQVVSLQLDMSAVRVGPGRHDLQVYFQGAPAMAPQTWPVKLRVSR
jgi:hypothetical protein